MDAEKRRKLKDFCLLVSSMAHGKGVHLIGADQLPLLIAAAAEISDLLLQPDEPAIEVDNII